MPPNLTVVRSKTPLNDLVMRFAKEVGEDCKTRIIDREGEVDILRSYVRAFQRASVNGDAPEQMAKIVCCAMYLEGYITGERARQLHNSEVQVGVARRVAKDIFDLVCSGLDASAAREAKASAAQARSPGRAKMPKRTVRKPAKALPPKSKKR